MQIHVHGSNFEEVLKHIPKELLPKEYGGDDGTIQELVDHWEHQFMLHRDYLIEGEQFGTVEAKRVGQPRNAENLFGVQGSFRRLDVD